MVMIVPCVLTPITSGGSPQIWSAAAITAWLMASATGVLYGLPRTVWVTISTSSKPISMQMGRAASRSARLGSSLGGQRKSSLATASVGTIVFIPSPA